MIKSGNIENETQLVQHQQHQQNVNELDFDEHNKVIEKQLFAEQHVQFTTDGIFLY